MQSINQMNPTYSTQTKARQSTKRKDYLDWLRKKDSNAYRKVLKVEKRFKRMKLNIKKIRSNQEYISKYFSNFFS